jgi:DHA1 family inner membrane transport protein
MPWALLAAGALANFAAASSGTTRAPFLLDMARDLSTTMPLVADLVAATSVSWAVAGMLAGAGSDRWGRRPFLIAGPFALACWSCCGPSRRAAAAACSPA